MNVALCGKACLPLMYWGQTSAKLERCTACSNMFSERLLIMNNMYLVYGMSFKWIKGFKK